MQRKEHLAERACRWSSCSISMSFFLPQVEQERNGKQEEQEWNVREDTRLLDAVEMFGYGGQLHIS